jgi:hypothetical protein
MTSESLRIGALAKATQTKVETVRYYERIGLLPAPARGGGQLIAQVAAMIVVRRRGAVAALGHAARLRLRKLRAA